MEAKKILVDDRYLIYPVDNVVFDTVEAQDIPQYVFEIRDAVCGCEGDNISDNIKVLLATKYLSGVLMNPDVLGDVIDEFVKFVAKQNVQITYVKGSLKKGFDTDLYLVEYENDACDIYSVEMLIRQMKRDTDFLLYVYEQCKDGIAESLENIEYI